MPITIGECLTGKWPARVSSQARVRGVFGILLNKDRFQVQNEMRASIREGGDAWLHNHFELTFPLLNSDGYRLPSNHQLISQLFDSVHKFDLPGEVRAMTATCDEWFYNNIAGIPTLVFGPGSLRYAHSKEEHIHVVDIL